jgi:predicted nucleotidyltransferase
MDEMRNVLDVFVERITDIIGDGLCQIVLYGSYARGDYNEHSDIDIMLLVKASELESKEYLDDIAELCFELEMEYSVYLSPVLQNIEEFNYWSTGIPFYQNVKREGVVMYGG